jgi:hypothetical protein
MLTVIHPTNSHMLSARRHASSSRHRRHIPHPALPRLLLLLPRNLTIRCIVHVTNAQPFMPIRCLFSHLARVPRLLYQHSPHVPPRPRRANDCPQPEYSQLKALRSVLRGLPGGDDKCDGNSCTRHASTQRDVPQEASRDNGGLVAMRPRVQEEEASTAVDDNDILGNDIRERRPGEERAR